MPLAAWTVRGSKRLRKVHTATAFDTNNSFFRLSTVESAILRWKATKTPGPPVSWGKLRKQVCVAHHHKRCG